MTEDQLHLAYNAAIEDDKKDDGKLHFATLDEWRLWRESQGIKSNV